ncbi:hypothetical protein [Pseudophaeobacter sp.]|uniref:hypothetical protein n=1 Tax=Pseudophaeobacter sp. TaxID=1971739 RepID=UPI0032997135
MNSQGSPFVTRRLFTAAALSMAAALPFATALPAQAGEALAAAPAGPELIMVEQAGCEWCKRWNDEIGPIYPKTREGEFAPLRRVDLRAIPDDVTVQRRVSFTPTFLIVQDGHEMARLEGYPGEDFFWPLIAKLMSKHLGFLPEGA